MEDQQPSMDLGFGLIHGKLREVVVELLPHDLSPGFPFHHLQWETVVCPAVIGILLGLLILFRLVQSMRSRIYVRLEKQLAGTLAILIKEKYQLFGKLSAAQRKYAEMESFLENARLDKEALNIQSLVDIYRKERGMKVMLMQELTSLIQELKEERSKCSKQEEIMAEMLQTPHHKECFLTQCMVQVNLLLIPFPGVGLGLRAVPYPPLRPPQPQCTPTLAHQRVIKTSGFKGRPSVAWSSSTFTFMRQK